MKRVCFASLCLLFATQVFGQFQNVPPITKPDLGLEGRVLPIQRHPLARNQSDRIFPGNARAQQTTHVGSTSSPIFYEAPTFGSGGYDAEFVATADVNKDGKIDLLVANSCSDSACANHGSVGVSLGNGNGTFQPAVTYDSGGYSTSAVAVGDVNGDGNPDLVVSNGCGTTSACTTGSVSVLLGNGDGTFQPAVAYSSGGNQALSVAVSDVNNDGKPDILVTNFSGTVGVLLGNGDGTFQPVVTYSMSGGATGVAVADVNNDGKPDLVVIADAGSDQYYAGVSVLLGNGDGTFQTAVLHGLDASYGTSVAVADVNGDGKLDIVATCQTDPGSIYGFGLVFVLLGNGDGTFQDPGNSYQTGGYGASSVAVADVNGDGKPDLLVANPCVGYPCNGEAAVLGVLPGNGDGTFQPAVTYDQGYGAITYANYFGFGLGGSIALADVNGDGKPDVLATTTDFTSGAVSVLLGAGNGSFDAAVNYYYSDSGFDPAFVVAGDVNGDGNPDLLVLYKCALFSVCPFPGPMSVGVLLGNGNGAFTSAGLYFSAANAYNPAALALADVNGDGKPDLLIVSECGYCDIGAPLLEVALGNGGGTFQTTNDYALNFSPNDIAVGDVNGDGKIDALVADTEGVEVLLGNGDGTFQPPTEIVTGSTAESVAVGDVNRDGKLDMVVANLGNGTSGSGSVSVFLGNGDGTFQPAVSYSSGAVNTTGVALADVNEDGKVDIVLTSQYQNGSTSSGVVGVLLGNGDGTFQAALNTYTPLPLGDRSLAVADFNGDGNLDLAIGYGNVLLLGNGDGTFQIPMLLGASGLGIATADFNNDGKPDLAVGGVTVLLNIYAGFHLASTTTLSASTNPSAFGQPVTFSATVTPQGSGTPTGSVAFRDGAILLCTSALNAGIATCGSSTIMTGTNSISAVYSGDSNFTGSTSNTLSQVVTKAVTTTMLLSSMNPSVAEKSVTFTATVSSLAATRTGTVQFLNGTALLATLTLKSGTAKYTTSHLPPGTETITAVYSGDANNSGSVSAFVNQLVHAPTTTTLSSSSDSSAYGQAVIFTAAVTSSIGAPPDGETVSFKQGSTVLGTGILSGGIASISISTLGVGDKAITAVYGGDANLTSSKSEVLSQVVGAATTTTTLLSSVTSSNYKQPVTFTATVVPQFGGMVTGSVTFMDGTTTLKTVSLSGSVAKCTTSTLAAGTHNITTTYNGSTDFTTSAAALTQTVN
jgi:hypothetical protein